MTTVGSLVINLALNTVGLSAGLAKASAELDVWSAGAGTSVGKAGAGFPIVATAAAAAGVAILAFGDQAVQAASKFNYQMSLIQTQANASALEVKHMSDAILDLAPGVDTGPEQLAKGLFHIESVGIQGAEALDVLTVAAKGALVGNANLEDVTNALLAAHLSGIKGITSYSQAMGVLNGIVGTGNLRMQDLASSLSSGVLSTAKTFGLSIQDVGAALATMADQGIPAEEAATRLRITIALLGAPTKLAAAQLSTIGLSARSLADDMRGEGGLIGALQDLKSHMDAAGLDATEQAQLLKTAFGGSRSSAGILTLINSLTLAGTKFDTINQKANSFEEDFAVASETAAAHFKSLEASLQVMAVRFGNVLIPVLIPMVDVLSTIAHIGSHLGLVFLALGAAIAGYVVKAFVGLSLTLLNMGLNFAAGIYNTVLLGDAFKGLVLDTDASAAAMGTTATAAELLAASEGAVVIANRAAGASAVEAADLMNSLGLAYEETAGKAAVSAEAAATEAEAIVAATASAAQEQIAFNAAVAASADKVIAAQHAVALAEEEAAARVVAAQEAAVVAVDAAVQAQTIAQAKLAAARAAQGALDDPTAAQRLAMQARVLQAENAAAVATQRTADVTSSAYLKISAAVDEGAASVIAANTAVIQSQTERELAVAASVEAEASSWLAIGDAAKAASAGLVEADAALGVMTESAAAGQTTLDGLLNTMTGVSAASVQMAFGLDAAAAKMTGLSGLNKGAKTGTPLNLFPTVAKDAADSGVNAGEGFLAGLTASLSGLGARVAALGAKVGIAWGTAFSVASIAAVATAVVVGVAMIGKAILQAIGLADWDKAAKEATEKTTTAASTATLANLKQMKSDIESELSKASEGFHPIEDFLGFTKVNQLKDQLDIVNAALAKGGSDAGNGWADGVVDGVIDGTKTLLELFGDSMAGVQEAAQYGGAKTMTEYAKGVADNRQAPVDAFKGLQDALKNAMTPAQEIARLIGELTSAELAEGLASGDQNVVAAAEALKKHIEERLDDLTDGAYSAGQDVGDHWKMGLQKSMGYSDIGLEKSLKELDTGQLDALHTKFMTVENEWKNKWAPSATEAADALAKLKTEIAGTTSVADQASEFVAKFGNSLSAIKDIGQTAGADLMAGIAAGIQSGRDLVDKSLVDLHNLIISGVTSTAREAMDIAALMGPDIAQGLSSGDAAQTAATQAAVLRILDELNQLTNGAFAVGTAARAALDAGLAAGGGANIHIDLGSIGLDQSALNKGREMYQKLVDSAKSASSAMSNLASQATSALTSAFDAIKAKAHEFFDALHEKNLQAIRDAHDHKNALLDAKEALNQAPVTAAQKALDAQRKAIEEWRLRNAVASARSPEEYRDAVLALQDFLAQKHIDEMQAQTDAANDVIDAQKKANDDLEDQQVKAENKRYEQQKKDFDRQLTALEHFLKTHPAEWRKTQNQILALLNKFGVSYKEAGALLGSEFTSGLKDEIGNAYTAMRDLVEASKSAGKEAADTFWKNYQSTLSKDMTGGTYVPTPPYYDPPNNYSGTDDPRAGKALGGPVVANVPVLVNENTPHSEWFVPSMSGTIKTPSQMGQMPITRGPSSPRVGAPVMSSPTARDGGGGTIILQVGDEKLAELTDRGLFIQKHAYSEPRSMKGPLGSRR